MDESAQQEQMVKRAQTLWISGDTLEAGRLIFEKLPNDVRPRWAANILRLVLSRSQVDEAIFAQVLYDAEHPSLWADGHRAFSNLRDATLKLDIARNSKWSWSKRHDHLANVLAVAELVAKVTYNAADPPDPFDEDSGWWIATCLKGFVDFWQDEEFAAAAWSVLASGE